MKDTDLELLMIGVSSLCRCEAERVKDNEEAAELKRIALREVSGRLLHRAHELAPDTYKEGGDDGQQH